MIIEKFSLYKVVIDFRPCRHCVRHLSEQKVGI